MRQVPTLDAAPFGIVGDGRVAHHFHHYLDLLGLSACGWSRRAGAESPLKALASCPTVLVLIRDAEIVPFIEAWPALKEKRLVHCSGSLVTPAAEAAHPLMTFGHELYSLADYRAIPFVLDTGGTPVRRAPPGAAESVVHDPGGRAPVLPRAVCHGRQLFHRALGEAVR